ARHGARWLEADLCAARAAFSTRIGGVSRSPYDELNVAILTGDDRDAVRENRGRLARALGRDTDGVLMGRQVHGAELQQHHTRQEPRVYAQAVRSPNEGDAHTTEKPRLTPVVVTADCLPRALVGPGGVGMAHCGWRGLAAGMVAKAAATVRATAAAVGPGIGPCCYEVGEEVLAEFEHLDGVAEGRMLDLTAVARSLLAHAGVTEVESADICTSCNE